MGILGHITHKVQHFSHGGRRVLTLSFDLPTGSSAAALHHAEMIGRLLSYCEHTYLPKAVAALEAEAVAGRAFLFSAWHCAIKLREKATRDGFLVTLTLSLPTDQASETCRTLQTAWDADGTLQIPLSRAKSRRTGRKKQFLASTKKVTAGRRALLQKIKKYDMIYYN
ncbi:MAG: hypothetical protein E7590_00835 [Ruminococcaceae bacterium]|nr:hypothetical protein [Oscillospiraceae bacterium]